MTFSFSKFPRTIFVVALLLATLIGPSPSKADPAVGVAVTAPLTPVTAGVAVGVTVVANELLSKRPFGPNGEGMKVGKAIINAPKNIVKQWFPHW
jgi:hypothetical protein